jgi:hypothetical protein
VREVREVLELAPAKVLDGVPELLTAVSVDEVLQSYRSPRSAQSS